MPGPAPAQVTSVCGRQVKFRSEPRCAKREAALGRAMAKKATTDHGEIIHFAGAHHLFPVAKKADALAVRLAGESDVAADELRVGWKTYFRPFIDRGLVFLHDEESGQAVTRAEADAKASEVTSAGSVAGPEGDPVPDPSASAQKPGSGPASA